MDARAGWPLVIALLLVGGCARSAPVALVPYTSERYGYTLRRPAGWHQTTSDEGRRTWFVPTPLAPGETPEARATEFIVVMSRDQPGPLAETEVRRLAMTLLPMHGISEFQQMPASTSTVTWHRFELTGATAGVEWASMGLLVTGPQRFHYVVCAAPLPAWRARQRLCDEVLRSFGPGDLAR